MKPSPAKPDSVKNTITALQKNSRPLRSEDDLLPLIDAIDSRPYVLIGEASHGTSDFYQWRAAITRRLVTEGGYRFIAVEGDWPDCYLMNRFVKGMPGTAPNAREAMKYAYERWPTWMWANEDVADFLDWLRAFNEGKPEAEKVGFYGLDVYSLWESMETLSRNLKELPADAQLALQRLLRCFQPYTDDAYDYARATAYSSFSCEEKVVSLLQSLRADKIHGDPDGVDGAFDKEQNAFVLKSAENYYRAVVKGQSDSWNVRDTHFMDTLDRLMAFYGETSKAIVWAHNTHVGDARFTDMVDGGEVNIGQLCRERHGKDQTYIIGFGSYEGTVTAGRSWDAPTEVMPLPKAQEGSWESLLHRAGGGDKLLIFAGDESEGELMTRRGHRAVGVVYRPQQEHLGNYVPSYLSKRYDAFLYIETTSALKPLHGPQGIIHELPDTYPFAT